MDHTEIIYGNTLYLSLTVHPLSSLTPNTKAKSKIRIWSRERLGINWLFASRNWLFASRKRNWVEFTRHPTRTPRLSKCQILYVQIWNGTRNMTTVVPGFTSAL